MQLSAIRPGNTGKGMSIKVVVFDFDGTLVESNKLKYDAYFELFPRDAYHNGIIRNVLSESFEESRYSILEKILKVVDPDANDLQETVHSLASRYNVIVVEGAKTCPECPDAERLLQRLSPYYPLYLSSTTPEAALCEIIRFRGWSRYFKNIFGYPRRKQETLRDILREEQLRPSQMLVVGDGESDRVSAEDAGCNFFDVRNKPLLALRLQLAGY